LFEQIDLSKLPQHIAVIMDGNGRWATQHGKPRVFGHTHGVTAVREITEGAAELGVKYLTLYAFSTENWSRPAFEVRTLMGLLSESVRKELKTLTENNIRLKTIGDLTLLPESSRNALLEAVDYTKDNDRMTLTLALNYSGRSEILRAVTAIAKEVEEGKLTSDAITDQVLADHLDTKGMPDPELLIRTSGELRISNFLLWQLAYTELYFSNLYWPEFRKNHLYEAILDFQHRQRRFGLTSEQINALSV